MDGEPTDPKPAFHKSFNSAVSSLSLAISNLSSLRGSSQRDAISGILSKVSELTLELKDAANYLPAYDQKVYSEQLKGITESLNTVRKAVAPRTKFSFKNRRAGPSDSTATPAAPAPTPTPPPPPSSSPQTFTLTALTSTRATPAPPTPTTTVLSLSLLTSCVILPPPVSSATFATASVTSITSSILVLPRISGPAHLTFLKNSVLVISCHQFRLHDSSDLDVYLRCGSRPIIERCSNIRVSRIPQILKSIIFKDGEGEGEGEDKWNQIDDFNWLKEGRPSPNWRTSKDEEKITDGQWDRITKEDRGVEDEGIKSLLP